MLLLDEPFGALDALTRMKMQDLLLDVHAKVSTTVLLVTHDVDEALQLADRILLLGPDEDGRPAPPCSACSPCPASATSAATLTPWPTCARGLFAGLGVDLHSAARPPGEAARRRRPGARTLGRRALPGRRPRPRRRSRRRLRGAR